MENTDSETTPKDLAAWRLPALREGHAAPADLVEMRRTAEAAAAVPNGVPWHRDSIGGIPCVVVEPEHGAVGGSADGAQPPVLVHLHGGGYRLGAPVMWVAFAHRLARSTGHRVVVPDYRLAPEHPFPAALHDAAAVWQALAPEEGDGPVLSGDSAGGGLAVALALCARSAPVSPPRRLVLFSPWLDLTAASASFDFNAQSDALFSRESAQAAADGYLQGLAAATQPLASPQEADPTGLPPVLLFAGTGEVLLDDAAVFTRRAAGAQVPVQTHLVPDLPHVWPVVVPDDPRSAAALQAVARFVGE
ncbi:alpha/beta hydrolase [Streptomyces sp. NPDC002577]